MYIISKTLVIHILLSMLFSNLSQGQNIHIVGGINFSKLSQQKSNSYPNIDRSYRPGFQIGSVVDIELNDKFGFMPGLLFSLKREYQESTIYVPSLSSSDQIEYYHFKSSINEYYLDLPLAMKYNFIIDDLNFYVLAGPYLNLLLFDNTTTELYVNEEPTELGNTAEGKYSNRFDYGINIGFGIDLKSFVIQASYDYGFFRTMKYKEINFDQSVRNSVIRLTIGYRLKKTVSNNGEHSRPRKAQRTGPSYAC
jgi:hypothetical protein